MPKLYPIVFVLLVTSACLIAPLPSNTGENPSTLPAQTNSVTFTDQPAATQSSSGSSSGGLPFVEYTQGSLWVRLFSPQDGDTVDTPTIKVKGQAPAETVITINDKILVVSADLSFETEVNLEEGPNLIEIVASDLNDNEVDIQLTVNYEP